MKETNQDQRQINLTRLLFGLWLATLVLGTFFPTERLWGVHLPGFLPFWAQFLLFGGMLVVLLLPPKSIATGLLISDQNRARLLRTPLPVIVIIAAFILFRSSAAFLGNGALRGREAQMNIVRPVEALASFLAAKLYAALHPTFAIDGQQALALLAILAGIGFLLIVWYYPRRIWDDPADHLLAWIILTFSGILVLFFGYLETYVFSATAIVCFLLSGEAYRRERGPFFLCFIFYLLALTTHFAAAVLFPALLVLGLTRRGRQLNLALIVLAGLVTLGWGYWIFQSSANSAGPSLSPILIAIFPRTISDYALFSPAHFLDLLNLCLLVCPGLLIAIPLLRADRRQNTETSSRYFWPAAVLCPLVLVCLAQPQLGMARDWGLFSLGLLPLIIRAAVRLTDSRLVMPSGVWLWSWVASVATVAMFAGLNASPTAAVARFRILLDDDHARVGYGHQILAEWYHSRREPVHEIFHWRRATQLDNTKQYWTSLSMAYQGVGQKERAYQAAHRAYALDTSWTISAHAVGAAYNSLQFYDSAIVYFERATAGDPGNHVFLYDLGMAYYLAGQPAQAEVPLAAALQRAPERVLYYSGLAVVMMESGRGEDAELLLQRGLILDPDDIPARVNLATLYYRTGRNPGALSEVARVLANPGLTRRQRTHAVELEKLIRSGVPLPDSTKNPPTP